MKQLGDVLNRAKIVKFNKEQMDFEKEKVKLTRKKVFNPEALQTIIEEGGLIDDSEATLPLLQPAQIDKNMELTGELLAQL